MPREDISTDKCPECKYDQVSHHLNNSTLEQKLFCPNCGYRCWTTKTAEEKQGFQQYKRLGYGVYYFSYKNGFSRSGVIHDLPRKAEIDILRKWCLAQLSDPIIDVNNSYMTIWDGQKIINVHGNPVGSRVNDIAS